jgi:serine/threonine protein kinase
LNIDSRKCLKTNILRILRHELNIYLLYMVKDHNNKAFFSSGEYGCAIYPRIKCNNVKKSKKDSRMISKVTIQDFYSENEYAIGKILKKVNTMGYFIPIEKKCSISKKKITSINSKYDCKATQKHETGKKFILLYSKFDPSDQLSDIIGSYTKDIKLIYKFYLFTLKCIDILIQNNIVHHDLHLGNIILNKNNDFKLIDFGLSIMYDKVKNEDGSINHHYLEQILITFDDTWCYWSIEKHLLNYLVFKKKMLNEEVIEEIVDHYYGKNKVFNLLYNNNELKQYKKKIKYHYLELLSGLSFEDSMMKILDESYKTWDLYQLSYLMIYLLQDKLDDIVISLFVDIFKKNLHYDYKRRLNVGQLLKLNLEVLRDHKNSKIYQQNLEISKPMLSIITMSKANSVY